jgi:hypothetical protein
MARCTKPSFRSVLALACGLVALLALAGPSRASMRVIHQAAPWWSWPRCERILLVALADGEKGNGALRDRPARVERCWKTPIAWQDITLSAQRAWTSDGRVELVNRHALVFVPPAAGLDAVDVGPWEVLLLADGDVQSVVAYMDDVARAQREEDPSARSRAYLAAMLAWSRSTRPAIEKLLSKDLSSSGLSPWELPLEGPTKPFVDAILAPGGARRGSLQGFLIHQVETSPNDENVAQLARLIEEDPVWGPSFMVRRDLVRFLAHAPIRKAAEKHLASPDARVSAAVRSALDSLPSASAKP